MSRGFDVAILGATGAVGHEFLRILATRGFPIRRLKLLASPSSAGKTLQYDGVELRVEALSAEALQGVDVAFFSAGAARSRDFAPAARAAGTLVVDNSSAYRMDPEVPLVVPEVNFAAIRPTDRLVANPNCTAAILLMAIAPLRAIGKIERLIVSTYQSASGAGAAAMRELADQTRDSLEGRPVVPRIMPHPYAFNLFSHNTPVDDDGFNDEENKVVAEVRRILDDPALRINITCVRVPVMRAHSESVTVEFDGPAPAEAEIRRVLEAAPGVRVVDDRAGNHFPMPIEASGEDDVLVGRIRADRSHPSAIQLFVAGDQLLKGAALNAVQIAERMIEAGYLSHP